MRLLVGGKELDIEPTEWPRFTFQLDDIEDITAVRGAKSTTIEVPSTNANALALGGYAMAEEGTGDLTCQLLEGTAAYFDGIANVTRRSNAGYALSAVGSSALWMTLLKDVNLRDLDMGFTEVVDAAYVENTWTDTTTDLYFPVVDYGSFELRGAGYDVPFNRIRPGVRVLNFLRRAFLDQGFSLISTGAFNDLFPKLVMLNTNDTVPIGEDLRESTSAEFASSGPQALNTLIPSDEEVEFQLVISDPSLTYTGTGRYTSPFDLTDAPTLTIQLGTTFFGGAGTVSVRIQLYDFTNNFVVEERSYLMNIAVTGISDTFTFNTFSMGAGWQYGFRARATYAGFGSAITQIQSVDVKWNTQDIGYQSGLTLDIARQAPKMRVLDCFKWMCTEFCLQVKTVGSAVTVCFYDDFYQPVSNGFIDITQRVDGDSVKQTDPIPSAFIFRQKEDGDDRLIRNLRDRDGDYGAGDHKYATGGSDDEKEIEVGFAATAMDTLFTTLRVPAIRDRDAKILEAPNPDAGFYPDRYGWEPRLCIADGLATGSWTFAGVGKTTYPNCYSYSGSSSGLSSLFGQIAGTPGNVTRHWLTKIRRWISAVLVVDAFWADHELMNFDPSKPVKAHDGQMAGFYYVQKIEQHQFALGLASGTSLIPL